MGTLLQDFAYISEQKLTKIVEIGGGKVRLAHNVLENNEFVHWTMIEPNPTAESDLRLTIIEDFFDDKTQINMDTDTIVMSQVFEDIYEPKEMARQLAKKMQC